LSVVAVVKPKPTTADVRLTLLKLVVGVIAGTLMAGVVGPIILAIIVGEIWGH